MLLAMNVAKVYLTKQWNMDTAYDLWSLMLMLSLSVFVAIFYLRNEKSTDSQFYGLFAPFSHHFYKTMPYILTAK